MSNTYSAGTVTAYGAAVEGGYTGTYAEFCAQQAEYADNAEAVEQAKTDAETAASNATTSETNAETYATNASASATSAASSASSAATSESNASTYATSADASATSAATSATNAATSETNAAESATEAAESAASVTASAEQIATNTADITEIKSDIATLETDAFKPYASRGQILYSADTAVDSGHIVNAVALDDGTIIACRSTGSVVRIGYDGTEETLLSLTGTNMDWRLCCKDSNNNVYVSPHASYGSMTNTDNGLYKMESSWTADWTEITLAEWQTGSLAYSQGVISVNSNSTAFRSTYVEVTAGKNIRATWYATSSTTNVYGIFTDDSNTSIASAFKPTDGVAGYRTSDPLTVPSGATRLWFMTYYQSDFETACSVEESIPAFTKVIPLYDTSSSVETETETNDDTIWTMCEDSDGNLYAGVYAHTVRANPAIYKSTDGGDTWVYLFNFNTEGLTDGGMHIHTVIYSPWQDALYCIVGEVNTIFKSTDGGSSWTDLGVALNAKGSAMCATPFGILIGSDSAYNCEIDILFNDDSTHKTVFSGWANTVFAIRRSDLTGFLYAFTKVDSSVNSETIYPSIEAITDSSVLEEWENTSGHNVASWTAYYNSVIDTYPDDAIRPQHCAILVSRDGGARWEVLHKWELTTNGTTSTYIDGFWTTSYFQNGECLTGFMQSNAMINPIVISEGKHKYVSGGCDLDGEIFVRTNSSSTVTII